MPFWTKRFSLNCKQHRPEQIIGKLREAEAMLAAGKTIGQVCQALEIGEPMFHRWRNQYGGMKAEEAKRLQELEEENKRLKKLLAEVEVDPKNWAPIRCSFRYGNGRIRRSAWMTRKRRVFGAAFKAKVALAAVRGDKSTAQLASEFSVHTSQVTAWKKQLLDQAAGPFRGRPHGAA